VKSSPAVLQTKPRPKPKTKKSAQGDDGSDLMTVPPAKKLRKSATNIEWESAQLDLGGFQEGGGFQNEEEEYLDESGSGVVSTSAIFKKPRSISSGNALQIYTDGSSLANGKAGAMAGVGVFFGNGDARYEDSL
jgi:hypothetical protein